MALLFHRSRIIRASFHRLSSRSQRPLEVARHLYIRELGPAVFGAVCRAVQHQDGCFELRDEISKLTRIARGTENDGLHITYSKDVVQDRSATTRVPQEPDPIGARIWQSAHGLHQLVHRPHGLGTQRIGTGRRLRTNDWGYETGPGPAAPLKPAGGHGEETTTGQILSQAHIFLGEAVRAMQEKNGREWAFAGRSRHSRPHDAQTRDRYFHPRDRKCFGSGRRVGDRHCRVHHDLEL
jgi:hypothetical protein